MLEKMIAFSIARRGVMMLLAGLVFILGLWQFQQLPIDAVPDITNVQVQINTEAPGFTPEEVETQITYPIEQMLMGLPALSYTRSLSRYALSQVTVVFEEGTDLFFARNLINARLNLIRERLPNGLEPTMGPIATGLSEIFMYSVTADVDARQANGEPYDPMALRDIQDWIVRPQLALVKGVTEINTIGGYARQFHITPLPQKMFAFDVRFEDIIRAVKLNNRNQGAGYIERHGEQVLVRVPGQLSALDSLGEIVIKKVGDAPVMIKQVADLVYGKELRTGAATQEGAEAVVATVMMLQGGNAREIALRLADRVAQLESSLPSGVKITVLYDRTILVDKVIATVEKNLLEGALLVIVVLFLLLGNLRAALITAAVIPLAMFATITGMVQSGVSANLMSLGALDFGLIVDGAVIIVENCIRRLGLAQQHKPVLDLSERLDLVYRATAEVIRPSLFGVFIITLVYIPIFSLTGVEGKMFHPMASTVVMALLASMVLSLTVVPAAVALFIRGRVNEKENVLIRGAQGLYVPLLRMALKLRWLVVMGAMGIVAFAIFRANHLGAEFIPKLDEGDIALHALRVPGTSLSQAIEMQTLLEKELLTFSEVERVFSRIGTAEVATDPMPPNVADTFIMLKPRDQWPDPTMTKADLIVEMQMLVENIPGNNYEFTQPIEMRFNELIAGVRSDLGIKIFGDDFAQLKKTAGEILTQLNQIEGVADARIEQVDDLPVLSLNPDRLHLARHDLNVADLQSLIATAINGEPAGLIYQGDRRYDIVVRLPESVRGEADQLADFPVALADGTYIPLSELADLEMTATPNQISRENARRRIVVTANVRGRDLGSFVKEAQEKVAESVSLPVGYWIEYGGTFEQLASASERLLMVVPIVLLVILSLLTIAFRSLRDALIIFTGVPFALSGGIFALTFRDMPFSISAGVGFIALSGIAVLNGLVLLSFIRERLEHTQDLLNAIIDGARTRLRPVLMTALVASLGFVPMALNTGTGAEVQKPLATVVIGGIMSSTLLTLFVLPVLFLFVHKREMKKMSREIASSPTGS